jgi:hypothetical protein
MRRTPNDPKTEAVQWEVTGIEEDDGNGAVARGTDLNNSTMSATRYELESGRGFVRCVSSPSMHSGAQKRSRRLGTDRAARGRRQWRRSPFGVGEEEKRASDSRLPASIPLAAG